MSNSMYQDTSKEPLSMLEGTKHYIQILDAKYEQADFRAIMKNDCKHLSAPEQSLLLELLQEFEELFYGRQVDWDCEPVSPQLNEGANSYHGQPFPTPKKHLETTKREIQRLCALGVLKWQDDSEFTLPSFIVSKKDKTLRVVSAYHEFNKKIVSAWFYKN